MKKFYFLAAIFFIGFASKGLAQYTATSSGKWSSALTWAPGVKPSTICDGCTVTINAGVTVTLDEHLELTGTSILYIGDGNPGSAEIIIGSSSSTTIPTGYNIILDTLPGSSMVVLRNINSKIDAAMAGTYDGVFSAALVNGSYRKEIGNSPSGFDGNSGITNSDPPSHGTSVTGPGSLFSGGTLPITLANFNVVLNDNVVNVTWATDIQVNLSHFLVLRSGDGTSWETVGKVVAKATSSGSANYSFTDASPLHGINYYRLQSIDNGGNYKLSEVKLVRSSFIKGIIYGPNPANDHVRVTFGSNISSNVTLRLLNQYGQILQQKQVTNAAGTTVSLQVHNYPQGIYTLHIKGADGSQSTFRVLVTR